MNLLIIGASARAAAFSARRAGLAPWCVDLFGDADLQALGPVRRVAPDDYPRGLSAALADAPEGPVLYTGGLENYPDLLADLGRPLWGNTPAVLRQVRSPYRVADLLRQQGLPALEVRAEPPVASDGRAWLLKPLRGSGGIGVRAYRDGERFDSRVHYLQERAHGHVFGAVYIALTGQARLLGVTSMLDVPWTHAPGFHYQGSMLVLGEQPQLRQLGEVVARGFGLRGLFGIDVVYDPDRGGFVVLEVNPRYTASVEILERAGAGPLLAWHRLAFDPQAETPQARAATTLIGKAVLYARRDTIFPAAGPWLECLHGAHDQPDYADIPPAGTAIARGKPVLTVFARGESELQCLQALRERTQALDRYLGG